MSKFIAGRIIREAEASLERGQAKYRAYFVNITIYEKYRADAEAILIANGYEDCIVTE